jgi:outer membrane protein assembly factor BamB
MHVLAVGGTRGRFASLDAATGKERWVTRVRSEEFGNPPVVGGGVLFIVGDRGRIIALRTSDGSRLPVDLDVGDRATLALVNGTLYAQTASTSLFAFTVPG